jgi:hypothetical protein
LSKAAAYKAQDMVNRKYFSHTDPSGNYIWPTITAYGYTPYTQLGENLAIEFSNTESLVQAWMNSPTHRANILNEGFKDQGMGVSFGNVGDGEYSSSIANTFGSLTIKKQPEPVAVQTTPEPIPTPTPATPTPTPTTPKPQPKPTPKPVEVKPTPPPTTPTPTPTSTPQPIPTSTLTTTAQNNIKIDPATLLLTTNVQEANAILSMEIGVAGSPDTVVAHVADKTIVLEDTKATSATSTYTGQVKLLLDDKTAEAELQIFAQDRYGHGDFLSRPLKEVASLPIMKAIAPLVPASFNNVQFDFYAVNRYVTLSIGIILLLFMVSDIRSIAKRKLEHLDKRVNNFILLGLSLIIIAVMYWL